MHFTLFQILAVLRNGPADATTLLERLRELDPDGCPSVPALYRHVRRADEEGWIRIEGHDGGEDGPGRPSRVYALSRAGRWAVAERARKLARFTGLALEGEGEPGG